MTTVISRKYEVLDLLGQGGMGIVYKVRHAALDTIRALKALPRELMDNQDMVRRFYREARVMAQFRHPNIVRVLDVDSDETLPCHYFVMEYIQGQTLRQYLQDRGPLPLMEVLEIGRQVAQALSYTHHHNPSVLHRDIKPSNIMIEHGSRRAVVMDFGIAKELDQEELTKSGVVLGTLKYSAPEQFRREPIEGSADVYSLGMVLYEAYAGKSFFADLEEHNVIVRLLSKAEEHEPRFTRPTPPEFTALVAKAIAKSRARRYQHIDEFLRDLEACWKALANAGVLVTSGQSSPDLLPGTKPQPSLSQIEEEIHKLEQERQRQLSLIAQTQARDSRECAVQDGAGRWATARFQQGLEREERGHALLRNQEFVQAQQAYQEAVSLFTRAGEEAKATALLHQVEQTRKDMETAKTEAERYGARERARTFYGRALALQAQADELWDEKLYEQASRCYAEARGIFADARELAYQLELKDGAETAREAMNVIRAQALQEGAESVASGVLQEAARTQQQADKALSYEEFTQARELYKVAQQCYEAAREQARESKAEQEVLLSRQTAMTTREQVAALAPWAPEQWAVVQASEQAAEHAWLEQDYQQASALYEQLHRDCEQLRQEAEEAKRRQPALEARRQVEQQQQQFLEEAEAQQYVGELYQQALDVKREGECSLAARQWEQAVEQLAHAQELFVQARYEVRLHKAKLGAEAARTLVLAAQMEAAGENGSVLFPGRYEDAAQRLREADLAFMRAEFGAARVKFDQSTMLFTQIYRDTVRYQQRGHAEQSRSRALQMQEQTNLLSGRQTRRAEHLLLEADQLFQQQQYIEAYQRYEKAAALLSAPSREFAVLISVFTDLFFSRTALMIGVLLLAVTLGFYVFPHQIGLKERAQSRRPLQERPLEPLSSVSSAQTPLPDFLPQHEKQQQNADDSLASVALPGARTQNNPETDSFLNLTDRKKAFPEQDPDLLHPQWEIRRFQGVASEVYFVAVSPDGEILLSGNREKTLSLWSVSSGQKLRMLAGHADWVTSVAFSPDGKTAISGSDDKTVKLWEVKTGKAVRTFAGHTGVVTSVAFSSDGKTVLSGSSDRSMKLWDAKTGQEIRAFTGHTGWIWAVAISPDGKTALSGSEDKTMKLWELSTGRELRTFSGHRGGVLSVAFAPDGKRAVSSSGDRTIKVWDVTTSQALRTLTGHTERIYTVTVSPDGKRVASASKDKTVKLWDIATGQEIRTFVGHTAAVLGIDFSPNGRMLVSGGRDKTLRLWWAGLEPAA